MYTHFNNPKICPVVSVIVPNYNHGRFLTRRLDSIFAQSYSNYEVIVLDDASTDESRDIIQTYASRYPIRLLFNDVNSGSAFIQWRRGAALARGKYLWIAESDDFADPAFLETLIGRLQGNPRGALAYSQSYSVDAQGQVHDTWTHWTDELSSTRWRQDYVNSGQDEVANYLVRKNTIPNASAVLVDRSIFLRAVEGSETMRLSGDWWTWCRVLLQGDVLFVGKPLNYFRSHAKSVRDNTKLALRCLEEFRLLAHISEQVTISRTIRREVFHEAFYKWRKCIRLDGEVPDRTWLVAVHAHARKVRRSATLMMAWYLCKTFLKKIRGVSGVIGWIKACGSN